MKKSKAPKSMGVRKFVTGESRYCQCCGKESFALFEIIQDNALKIKLQYCKQCADKVYPKYYGADSLKRR